MTATPQSKLFWPPRASALMFTCAIKVKLSLSAEKYPEYSNVLFFRECALVEIMDIIVPKNKDN